MQTCYRSAVFAAEEVAGGGSRGCHGQLCTEDASDFRNLRAWNSVEEEPDRMSRVVLEPMLELDYDGLKLGFRLGKDKLYQVKNLPELVSGVEAEKFYQYIRQVVTEESRREAHSRITYRYYENTAETIKGKISLYGRRLDDFFELAKGETLNLADKSEGKTQKTVLNFREADPDIEIVIAKETDEKGVFQGVRINGTIPELLQGLNYQYFFSENTLNRI